jgi:hypothetical protein
VYLNCYPGVDGWACDCGDNDESILISATLGDDVWDSCNTAAEQCVSTLDLSFGAN